MMTWIIILIFFLLVGGIIFVSSQSPSTRKPREEFLKELASFWEGELKALEGGADSFQITFNFKGRKFIFEDIIEKGFKDKINRVVLKAATSTGLDLYFTQREQKSVQMKTIIVSDIPDEPLKEAEKINLPLGLKDFNAHTNNPRLLNKIFEDTKTTAILTQFKNVDIRGYSKMPLRIQEGSIILEFYTEAGLSKPHVSTLYSNVSSLEKYLEKFVELAKRLEGLSIFQ